MRLGGTIQWAFAAVMLAVITYSGWQLVSDRIELRDLKVEQQRLEQRVGRLEMDDPSQIGVACFQDKPWNDVGWRLYVPPGVALSQRYKVAGGGGGSSWRAAEKEPRETLIRLRLLEDDEGRMTMFLLHASGSASNSLPSRLGDFLEEHWEELDFTTAGVTQPLYVNQDQVVTLIEVNLPEELLPHVKEEVGEYLFEELQKKPLISIELGDQKAFDARDQAFDASEEGTDG